MWDIFRFIRLFKRHNFYSIYDVSFRLVGLSKVNHANKTMDTILWLVKNRTRNKVALLLLHFFRLVSIFNFTMFTSLIFCCCFCGVLNKYISKTNIFRKTFFISFIILQLTGELGGTEIIVPTMSPKSVIKNGNGTNCVHVTEIAWWNSLIIPHLEKVWTELIGINHLFLLYGEVGKGFHLADGYGEIRI